MSDNIIYQPTKQTRYRLSFYANVVLFLIVIISNYLLVIDCITYGKSGGDTWLYVARDLVFLVAASTFIFVQLFRYLFIISRRSL